MTRITSQHKTFPNYICLVVITATVITTIVVVIIIIIMENISEVVLLEPHEPTVWPEIFDSIAIQQAPAYNARTHM